MRAHHTEPLEPDAAGLLAHLIDWAADLHDEASPSQVTDVLVAFAFVVGVNLGVHNLAFATALLRQLEKEIPDASESARQLARELVAPLNGSRPVVPGQADLRVLRG